MQLDPTVKITYFKFPTANNRSYDLALNDASFTMLEMREELERYIRNFSETFTSVATMTPMSFAKPWLIYGVGLGLLVLLVVMTAVALAFAILLRRRQKSAFFSVQAEARKGGTRFSLYAGDYFDDVGNGQCKSNRQITFDLLCLSLLVYRQGHLERCLSNGDSSVDLPLDQIIRSTLSR